MHRYLRILIAVVALSALSFTSIPTAVAGPTCSVYKVRKVGTQSWQRWGAYGESQRVKDFIHKQAKLNLGHAEVVTVGSGYGTCGGVCCPTAGGQKLDINFGAI